MKFVVSWMYNGETYNESFTSRMLAEIRMIQLEAYKLKPTLHERGE